MSLSTGLIGLKILMISTLPLSHDRLFIYEQLQLHTQQNAVLRDAR